ncbi:MAG TPA: NAD-dependent dihydropyrimidine dehydrogenase subunit PreA [Pyrinomonadaceae bacterium]|nr:NAD-dependent dihydropyrimidine dehydrogenase subunit PreA [Pyrinomonadaceae bacterium]HMP65892.1 NAD-dependent dihydropyrimidine dehydrogenase subunit PreA [Pyrinomonadaceae bacterium]
MADLSINFAGIKSPNPLWLASAPPTNMGSMVERAFDAGWGGAVWKTLGEPIVNVSSRLAGLDHNGQRMIGLNNIELITDRPLEVNLKEMAECKRKYPNHAVIASLMVESKREAWHEIVKRTQDTGCDGFELNFGCPHGMSERGMGSAMGQVPEYTCMVTEWVKEVSEIPVIVKLTPNVAHIGPPGRAAQKGGADAVSLINTINSIMGVDLETMVPHPNVNGMAAHGGYCGPAVKPIALNMVSELARDPEFTIPISGIGGISSWRDAVEFLLLGAANVQVCTAVMHYGYRIVEDMIDGLNNYLDEKGLASVNDIVGRSVPRVTDWGDLDLNYDVKAHVNEEHCIRCNLCYIACEDGAHQSFEFVESNGHRYPRVIEEECVGCNLCALVCPSPGAITMERRDGGGPVRTWREMSERQE